MKNLFAKLKNSKVRQVLLTLIIIGIFVGGFLYFQYTTNRVFIDDSLVSAPITSIAPITSGVLQQLSVYEGETVGKGQSLAIVDGQNVTTNTQGLIIQANNQIGSIVSSTNPVAQLIDPSQLRIAGTIDENKGLDQIKVGQVVSFTIDALPNQTFWGYVDEISPSAKQTTLSFSISSERPTQQFVVYARFDSEKYPQIKNGMSAKMVVFTKTN